LKSAGPFKRDVFNKLVLKTFQFASEEELDPPMGVIDIVLPQYRY